MDVQVGEEYIILIDNASKKTGESFDLSFGGTAILGEVIEADFLVNPIPCGKTALITRATSCNGQRMLHDWRVTNSQGKIIAEESGNENPQFDLNIPDTYNVSLKVTSLTGATATKTKQVVIADVVTAKLASTVICNQVSSSATATSCYNKNFAYEWTITDIDGKPIASQKTTAPSHTTYLNSGTYKMTLKVTNGLGTTASKDTTLTIDVPTLQLTAPDKACFEDGKKADVSAKIIARTLPSSYKIDWYAENGSSIGTGESVKVSNAGKYLAVLSYESCKISSTPIKITEYCSPVIYMPTAFSPNGDGLNDKLTIWGKRFVRLQVEIYDQWGNLLFSKQAATDAETVAWEGFAENGTLVPSGTYVVQAHYFDAITSRPHTEQTAVTLIR